MDRNAEPAELLYVLAGTPKRFEAAAALSSEQGLAALDGWSPNEILWHVRAAADVYGEQIARILEEDTPGWRHVSPRARMKKSRYDQVPFAESLAAFQEQRASLVARLAGLPPEAWRRAALVKVARQGDRRATLHERVCRMLSHEEEHCAQVERLPGRLARRR